MTVKTDLPNFSNLSKLATERATDRAVARVQEQAVTTAPVDSGNYRRNIVSDFNNNEVRAEAIYSKALEYGLPARTITPKSAKALRFEIDGKVIYTKKVRLPATRPQSIMRNSARTVQREIPKIFKQELNRSKQNV